MWFREAVPCSQFRNGQAMGWGEKGQRGGAGLKKTHSGAGSGLCGRGLGTVQAVHFQILRTSHAANSGTRKDAASWAMCLTCVGPHPVPKMEYRRLRHFSFWCTEESVTFARAHLEEASGMWLRSMIYRIGNYPTEFGGAQSNPGRSCFLQRGGAWPEHLIISPFSFCIRQNHARRNDRPSGDRANS